MQFDKWTHEQRKQVLEDLIHKSKVKEKGFIREYVKDHVPAYKRDFTRHLPRVICVYIFSFLDPRSLSRCAQVGLHVVYDSLKYCCELYTHIIKRKLQKYKE